MINKIDLPVGQIGKLINELCPDGVEFKELGEVASYVRGLTYSKANESNNGEGYKVLRANNITLSSNSINLKDVKIISKNVKVKETQKLQKKDIFICTASGSKEHIGKVAYVFEDTNYYFGGFMAVIRTNNNSLISRFLFHLLIGKTFSKYLETALNTTTINNLNSTIFNNFKIPIPPLPIQEEIVKILDKFTKLKTELEAELEAELKERKQQFEYYRDELLTFGDDVKFKELGEVAQGNLSYGSGASAINYDENIRYIRITDINEGGGLNNEIKSPSEIDKKYILNDGDILFARSGATVGKTFRYKSSYGKSIYAGYLIRFIANKNKVLPDFVYHFTKSKIYRNFVEKNKSTGSQPNINAKQYSSIKIPLPSLPEQERIVAILDKFDALVNDISIGLPAEIAERQKQYEYYREKLLTFKKLEA